MNGMRQSRVGAGHRAVTLISTVLNEVDAVGDFVDAIHKQSRKPDEVIIVDGGSTDGTAERIKELFGSYSGFKLLSLPGSNIAAGRNLAIGRSVTDLIATTDFGCRPDKEWLRHLLEPFEGNDDADIVAGTTIADPKSEFEECAGKTTITLPEDVKKDTFFPTGRNSAFRREVWTRVGGYPEELYCGEDTLFAFRVKRAGFRTRLADGALVYWRPRSTLAAVARQYYLYGLGNGRAGISSRAIAVGLLKYGLLIISVAVWAAFSRHAVYPVALACLGAMYIVRFHAFFTTRYQLKGVRKFLLILVLLRVQNLAEFIGYLMGRTQRQFSAKYRALQ